MAASSAERWHSTSTYWNSRSRPAQLSWASSVSAARAVSTACRSALPETAPKVTDTSRVEGVSRGVSSSSQGARAAFWAVSLLCSL